MVVLVFCIIGIWFVVLYYHGEKVKEKINKKISNERVKRDIKDIRDYVKYSWGYDSLLNRDRVCHKYK